MANQASVPFLFMIAPVFEFESKAWSGILVFISSLIDDLSQRDRRETTVEKSTLKTDKKCVNSVLPSH